MRKTNRGYIKPTFQFKVIFGSLFIALIVLLFSATYTETTISQLAAPVEAKSQDKILSVKDYIWIKAKENGLDPLDILMIIKCESNFNPEAINVNKNGTVDIGIAQINSIHKDISISERLDPYKSVDWLIKKRLKDGNYSAWVCAKYLGIK